MAKFVMLLCAFILSCSPAFRQAVLPKANHQLTILQKGSHFFSEEEERFIQQEAKALGIPVPDREEIRRFIDFYTRNKRHIETSLQRASLYMPVILPIIRQHNMPEELALLPVIESAYNNFAVSRSGAAGLWQFIPSTARRYGLRVDSQVDERFDVAKATDAAMRYLKDLYNMFGSWELALASYNCGENCVSNRTGGLDFWITQGALPLETRNYVPAFFAVLLISRNPQKYGINASLQTIAINRESVNKDTPVEELTNQRSIRESVFRDLNPHIKGSVVPAGSNLYMPARRESITNLPNGAKLIQLE